MATYKSVTLAKRPVNEIILGETFAVVEHGPVPLQKELEAGEVVLAINYISIDPGMRDWLNDDRSYMPPVEIGEIMRGFSIGAVIASKSTRFPVGSHAFGLVGWTEFKRCKEEELELFEIQQGGQLIDGLAILGMTSLTAYFGIIDIGNVKQGDFVVISGAAGATGSVAGQIAKIHGATVLGIAGSDSKCRWLTEDVGFDAALNYKDSDFATKFEAATKDLIDVFYDNVGGAVLELALSRAKPFSRFVICGGVSQVNTQTPQGPKNYLNIIYMRIRMQGFLVFDYADQFAAAREQLAQWMSEGKIKGRETIVKGGLGAAEKALRDVYRGVNTGKLVVEVGPVEDTRR